MKVYKIIVLLFSVMCANAMDTGIISLVRRRYNSRDSFFKDSKKLNNGCLDELPLELHGRIIKDIFNLIVSEDKQLQDHVDLDQAVLERYGLAIPIVLGCKFCHDLSKLQQYCKNEIGGKKFLAHKLFFLPLKEQEAFIHMAEHPLLVSGNIMPDDYEIVKKMSPTITEGLQLRINYSDLRFNRLCNIGGCTLVIDFAMLVCMMMFVDQKTLLAKYLGYVVVTSGVGGCVLAGLGRLGMAYYNTGRIMKHNFYQRR